ncbi:MAG: type I DNA topoisomerase [Bdellovibrionales bacterium]
MSQKIVVVESPAKAKTINKYLGKDYTVIASVGHIRDLPPKDGSVRPDEDFAMDWELSERAARPVGEIARAAKGADALYLATDPDREGEAIAWHVLEVLREKGLTKSVPVYRVTFNEITKQTVLDAIAHPREIDKDLVEAYMARRALDYLVGFSLSPVLWRKLPGARSAGRVQSVALRIICDRESEIEKFKAQEFWSIEAIFNTAAGAAIPARLTHLDGKKLDKFAIQTESEAQATLAILNTLSWKAAGVEKKQTRRNPYPPFTTSTLQQEASRKIGLGATRTMRTAQQLYEGVDIGGDTVGLITYMRTDGVTLSQEAINGARDVINQEYGKEYVPSEPRVYKSAAKNAQEAHEAVRPTDMRRKPESVAPYLDQDQLRLYTLIWQRTMASQMASAVLDQVAVDIGGTNNKATFRATGSVVVFDGWLKVYQESVDDDKKADDDDGYGNVRLPAVNENDPLVKKELKPEQHFTQPPPRFTEASLVKRLEELGIGRPSTYASIMQVLQDRDYVILDKKRFVPEDRGRVVTAFLENFFGHYVEYDFTADLEGKLDDISGGKIDWKQVLRNFWTEFSAAIDGTKDLKISDVIDALDEALGPHFFPEQADGSDPRLCSVCKNGRMGLKLGRYGAFLGCSNYPECRNTKPLAVAGGENDNAPQMAGPRELGPDPETNLPVTVRVGPYGAYVQLGPLPGPPPAPPELDENGKPKRKKKKKDTGPKPKRMSLPKGLDPNLIDLQTALKLLALPREVGPHPETREMITAGLGRFGPYIKMGPRYKSLAPDDDVLHVGLNRAVTLLAEPVKGRFGQAATPGKPLGEHPDDGKPVTLNNGRFGPYVKWGKVMATVTKSYDPENLTLKDAVEILAAKIAKGPSAKGGKGKKAAAAADTEAEAKPKKKKKAKS